MPLAMTPPSGKNVAPHLPRDIHAGIGEGFLQIQPETIFVALLDKDDLDGE
jgi:hypothetical protein